MTATRSRPLALYVLALRLYPRSFRERYAREMAAVLRAQLQDEPASRVWVRAVTDLARTVPARHLEVHMSARTRLLLSGGLATAGILALLVVGLGDGAPTAVVVFAAAVALAGGLALARRDRPLRPGEPAIGRYWPLLICGGAVALALAALAPTDLPALAWAPLMLVIVGGILAVSVGALVGTARLAGRATR